jgi:hypothetical protein
MSVARGRGGSATVSDSSVILLEEFAEAATDAMHDDEGAGMVAGVWRRPARPTTR